MADFPADPQGYRVRGSLLLEQGQYEAARRILEQGLTQAPRNVGLQKKLLDSFVRAGKTDQAAPVMERALANDPDNVGLRFICARLREESRDDEKAEKHYLDILAKDPKNAVVMNNLALLVGRTDQRLATAINYATSALNQQPQNTSMMDTLASLYLRQGQPEKALVYLEAANRRATNNANILFHLAQTQAAAKRWNETLATTEKLRRQFPDFQYHEEVDRLQKEAASQPKTGRP